METLEYFSTELHSHLIQQIEGVPSLPASPQYSLLVPLQIIGKEILLCGVTFWIEFITGLLSKVHATNGYV